MATTATERKRKQRAKEQGYSVTVVLSEQAKATLDAMTAQGVTQSEAINKILSEVA